MSYLFGDGPGGKKKKKIPANVAAGLAGAQRVANRGFESSFTGETENYVSGLTALGSALFVPWQEQYRRSQNIDEDVWSAVMEATAATDVAGMGTGWWMKEAAPIDLVDVFDVATLVSAGRAARRGVTKAAELMPSSPVSKVEITGVNPVTGEIFDDDAFNAYMRIQGQGGEQSDWITKYGNELDETPDFEAFIDELDLVDNNLTMDNIIEVTSMHERGKISDEAFEAFLEEFDPTVGELGYSRLFVEGKDEYIDALLDDVSANYKAVDEFLEGGERSTLLTKSVEAGNKLEPGKWARVQKFEETIRGVPAEQTKYAQDLDVARNRAEEYIAKIKKQVHNNEGYIFDPDDIHMETPTDVMLHNSTADILAQYADEYPEFAGMSYKEVYEQWRWLDKESTDVLYANQALGNIESLKNTPEAETLLRETESAFNQMVSEEASLASELRKADTKELRAAARKDAFSQSPGYADADPYKQDVLNKIARRLELESLDLDQVQEYMDQLVKSLDGLEEANAYDHALARLRSSGKIDDVDAALAMNQDFQQLEEFGLYNPYQSRGGLQADVVDEFDEILKEITNVRIEGHMLGGTTQTQLWNLLDDYGWNRIKQPGFEDLIELMEGKILDTRRYID